MKTINRPTKPYQFRDLTPEQEVASRAMTLPAVPIDEHPAILEKTDDDSRKITARSIPPAGLAARGTFVELASEIADEHRSRISDIAVYLQRLHDNFGDLHKAALTDMKIYGKLLLAANLLGESQDAIRVLQFNIRSAEMEASENGAEGAEKMESVRSTRSSVRALQKETEETADKLSKFMRGPEDESNRLVPDMHPGAASLVRKDVGYFRTLAEANPSGMVQRTREMASDCLDTIPVAVDRLVSYASTEMSHFKAELAEIEAMYVYASESPEHLDELHAHYQELLKKYDECLTFTLKLVGKMPMTTQHLFLDQLEKQDLIALENKLSSTLARLAAGNATADDETIGYLEQMLKGVGRAKEQHKAAAGTTEELARHGRTFLTPPRMPKITMPQLPEKGGKEE